jgi:predicted NAD/FAD-dependent oxidoreductase
MIRVHIIGTGISGLALASKLQQGPLAQSLRIAFIDKARAPGGRLTSRRIRTGDKPTLEPGARVFQSSSLDFHQQCEEWEAKGLVKEIQGEKLKGVGPERWWEAGRGGWSESLIHALVFAIKDAGGDRISWHFNTLIQPESEADITYDPPLDIPSPHIIVYTAPTPQAEVLLPQRDLSPVSYRKTFALMYPDVSPEDLPTYWRDPHPSLFAISTGVLDDGTPRGLVLQASPEQLGVDYDKMISDDETVKSAFHRVIQEAALEPQIKCEGSWQLKRWKFAQVAAPPHRSVRTWKEDERTVLHIGDGSSHRGGVEGSWHSAQAAAQEVEILAKDVSRI